MTPAPYFIGLMSGTSVDGIDAVVLRVNEQVDSANATQQSPFDIVASHCEAYPADLQDTLLSMAQPGINEIDRLGQADRQVADYFARAVLNVMAQVGLSSQDVTAIGSHGQTVRHRPTGDAAFTLQIGDPNRIAELTGITTVADFRRRDVAAGGQGAPLTPAFHRAAFASAADTTAVVNIGGIANASLLLENGSIVGFDTGPGNTLLDAWTRRHQGRSYDVNGDWAASGRVDTNLLQRLLDDNYFHRPPPKSTGPEYFNSDWLSAKADPRQAPVNIQRTLVELTALSITDAIKSYTPKRVAICGGGAHNRFLMGRLSGLLGPAKVTTTETMGIHPDWVEAACFAWLAYRTLSGLPGNEPAATGAAGYRVLGAIYPG